MSQYIQDDDLPEVWDGYEQWAKEIDEANRQADADSDAEARFEAWLATVDPASIPF